jgi:hypothetical protein
MTAALWLLAKALAAAALVGALLLGVRSCQEYYREQGREEVRTEWSSADNQRELEERQAVIDKQRAERAEEQRMAREKEKKDHEQAQREKRLLDRAVAAERAADGLRHTIARLDADSRDRRAEGTCAAAEREADAAATARELLSACAGRYRALGQGADELASQVMGLQDHVVVVQPEAAALLTTEDE